MISKQQQLREMQMFRAELAVLVACGEERHREVLRRQTAEIAELKKELNNVVRKPK